MLHVICSFQAEFEMYEEELRNLQNDLNKKDEKISQLENEQKRLYKKYKSLKGKSRGTIFCVAMVRDDLVSLRNIFQGMSRGIWIWSSKSSKIKRKIR